MTGEGADIGIVAGGRSEEVECGFLTVVEHGGTPQDLVGVGTKLLGESLRPQGDGEGGHLISGPGLHEKEVVGRKIVVLEGHSHFLARPGGELLDVVHQLFLDAGYNDLELVARDGLFDAGNYAAGQASHGGPVQGCRRQSGG